MTISTEIDWANLIESMPEASAPREIVPVGTYTVKVTKAEAGLAKSGNAKVELTMAITDEGPVKGRNLWSRINFATNSPTSMAITVEQLAEFGITRQWLATNSPTVDQIAKKLEGEVIAVRVGHREWEGKTYTDIKGYKAAATADTSDPF